MSGHGQHASGHEWAAPRDGRVSLGLGKAPVEKRFDQAPVDQQQPVSILPTKPGAVDGATGPVGRQEQHHILVVNDTQEILDLFRDILEEEGYRVSLYSYALQDIAEIEALKPDLVILDFVIGGEAHGWQLLQKMKMTRRTAEIPIIVCTAALQLARELDGHLRAKNVLVVLKPFDIDDLVEVVTTALNASSMFATDEHAMSVPGSAPSGEPGIAQNG